MDKTYFAATTLATCGAAVMLLDIVIITVVNGSFGPLDSLLFFLGLAGILVGLAAAAAIATRGATHRVPRTVGLLLAGLVVLGLLSGTADWIARRTYEGDNVGLRGEWSFFVVSVLVLVVSGVIRRHPVGVTRPTS
jgi:hypothetical protein